MPVNVMSVKGAITLLPQLWRTRRQYHSAALIAKVPECDPGVEAQEMNFDFSVYCLLLQNDGIVPAEFVGVAGDD